MKRAVYYKLLKIELLVIIALLLAILVVSVLNRRKQEKSIPPDSQTSLLLGASDEQALYTEFGLASYYRSEMHGSPTASGDLYDKNALTAAHRELPFDTEVRVTNMETGAQVIVRINDRGPYDETRILDVSEKAAQQLGFLDIGVAQVRIEVLE